MRRKELVLILSLFILLTGCATVRVVDQNGLPVPDHVVRGSIPSSGMRVDFALIHYFSVAEGDEQLDTYEYLNPYEDEHSINLEHLRSLTMTVHVSNPGQREFKMLLHEETPSTGSDGNTELLYNGKLSRKEFIIPLPVDEKGFKYQAWFEIKDGNDIIRFMSPPVHYEVVGRPVKSRVVSPISKEDTVTGVALDDPSRTGH